MSNRLLKQLLYGIFYVATFGGAFFLLYIFLFQAAPSCVDKKLNQHEEQIDCGGPCVPCAIKNLKPLKVLPVQLFDTGDGRTSVLVQVQNSNLEYGAPMFSYTLRLRDQRGAVLTEALGESLIYAGEVKSMVFPALRVVFSNIFTSEFIVDDVQWTSKEMFPQPVTQIRDIATTLETTKGQGAFVGGVVQNSNSYPLKKVVVGTVVARSDGLYINASKTTIDSILSFAEHPFKIFIPLTGSEMRELDMKRTKIFVEATR